MGKVVFPREVYTNYLFSIKWSTIKTNIQITQYKLNRLYLEVYLYIHICMQQQFMGKEAMNLKECVEENMEEFGGRRGKVEMLWLSAI